MCKIIPIGGTTCPECFGSGDVKINKVHIGYDGCPEKETFKCITCDGKGYVFEEVEWNSDERFD